MCGFILFLKKIRAIFKLEYMCSVFTLFIIFMRVVEQKFLINSLTNDKILGWSKFKGFAVNKINETEELKFVLGREENIFQEEENACYQLFLLFPKRFQRLLSRRC